MEQMETAQRLAGCSFGVGGVPIWGKLRASMEQMETAQRLAGCSFGVGGVPIWGKLRASMEQMETAQRLAGCSFGVGGVPIWGKLRASMEQMETAPRLAGCSSGTGSAPQSDEPRASHFETTVRDLGNTRYRDALAAMQAFTAERTGDAPDEIWFTEHEPVFTQGQAGRAEHLLAPGDIEVVQSDRGGQVTYHGPGQIVGYLLFDIRRMGLTVRGLVSGIENAIIKVLDEYGIAASARCDAPGVYVEGKKIAALGLRVRRGCAYHGFAFNIDMDLAPFARINPCGMAGLAVTQLKDLCGESDLAAVQPRLLRHLERVYPVICRRRSGIPDAWPA